MGNGPSRPDEITAEEQTRAKIIVSEEALIHLEQFRNREVLPQDDYPVDTFAGKGFFERNESKKVEEEIEKILKDHPVAINVPLACGAEQELVKKCYKVKNDKLECSGEVEEYLRCSKEALLSRLASIGS